MVTGTREIRLQHLNMSAHLSISLLDTPITPISLLDTPVTPISQSDCICNICFLENADSRGKNANDFLFSDQERRVGKLGVIFTATVPRPNSYFPKVLIVNLRSVP